MAKNITLLNRFHNTKSWFFFSCSWLFTNLNFSWYNLGTLSEDDTGNTMPTRAKIIKKIKTLKNHTFSGGTYLSSPYKGVPSPSPANQANHQFHKTWIYRNCDAFLPHPHPTILSNNYLISILFFVKVFLVNQIMLPNWKCKMIVTNLH